MLARGLSSEKVRVNLQTDMGKGAGARTILYQRGVNLWCPFQYKLLKYISNHHIRGTNAVSFIHSSLVDPQGLLSITMLLAHDQTF